MMQDEMQNDGQSTRQQMRQDRQARVGILRNPNTPPRPPARRASLTGRWPSLRSSRRAKESTVREAAESVVDSLSGGNDTPRATVPVRRAEDGSVQAIDIAGLMASVEEMGVAPAVRTPFAATMRADGEAAEPVLRRKPSILRAEAWLDAAEDEDALGHAFREASGGHENRQAPGNCRRKARSSGRVSQRMLMIVVLGMLVALVALVVLPAASQL